LLFRAASGSARIELEIAPSHHIKKDILATGGSQELLANQAR
jgi:hypothetical protein